VFLTLDYWNNKEARDDFIKSHQSEYNEIDKRYEELTIDEYLIGDFFW
jgi:hypothetical protein